MQPTTALHRDPRPRAPRLPARPRPSTRGALLMHAYALAALARRVRRLRRNRLTA